MFAYQMIYTACGPNKTGAFSVWSKSNEVTEKECDEIVKLMSYKKSMDAPYDPTPEEIRTLFPKKFGYFVLSSGRKCIAQSTYVGKVYSDLDHRTGNFVIHAYVFEQFEDHTPFGIVNTNIFRTELSYKEWHDDPIPASLPAVNVEVRPHVDESAIRALLSDANKVKGLASMLQAIFHAVKDSEKVVTFKAAANEQKTLYSLIGMLLPRCMYEKTTFTNLYSPEIEYSLASEGVELTKIRNMFEGGYGADFNYADEIAGGAYAFNFENALFADVPAERYVTDIIQTLKAQTLFDTLKKVDQINTIMRDLQCDADTAVSVCNARANNFAYFRDANDFMQTLDLLIAKNYVDKAGYANVIYNMIIKPKRWGLNSGISKLITFVYQNSPENVKDAIIYDVLGAMEAFGISKNQEPKAFLENVKSALPIDFADVCKSILRNSAAAGLLLNSNNKAAYYMYFDIVCASLQTQTSTEAAQKQYQELLAIFKKAVATKDFDAMALYLERVKTLGAKIEEWLVYNSMPQHFSAAIANPEELKFAFNVALALLYAENQMKLAQTLLVKNINAADLIPIFLSVRQKNTNLFDQIEGKLKQDANYQSFFIKKDMYVFKNTAQISTPALNKYYNEYYVTGYDNGIFFAKFKEYINAIANTQARINELAVWCDNVSKLDNSFRDVLRILEYIEKVVFAEDLNELLSLGAAQTNTFIRLHTRLGAVNPVNLSKKYEVFVALLLLQGRFGADALPNAVNENRVYQGMTAYQVETLAQSHFGVILNAYVSLKKAGAIDKNTILVSLLYPITTMVPSYKTYFRIALDKMANDDYHEFMAHIMAYGFNQSNTFSVELKAFVEDYVNSMKSGENKKLFKKVEKLFSAEEAPAVMEYIEDYLDNHKSFFEKLFGRKKKNKE